jgi:methionine biosynthesis protein MetW
MKHLLYRIKTFLSDLFVYPVMVQHELSYDQYWQEKKKGQFGVPNGFQLLRASWIAKRIENNASIVDVGCGDGSVLFAIQKEKSIRAAGLDVSKVILDFLKSKGVEAQFLDLSESQEWEQIPVGDHAMALEVLEHMSKPEDFLLMLLTKVNKSVFISVPNTGYIHHRLRLLFGKFPLQWRSHPSEHLRFWTLADFKWWLDQMEILENTDVYAYAGIPVLNKIWPSLFAQGILAEVSRKSKIA